MPSRPGRRVRSAVRPLPPRIRLLPPLLALALAGFASACDAPGRGPDSASTVRTRHGTVMGTLAEIKVYTTDLEGVVAVFDRSMAELARIEALTTPHDPASELSRLNAAAGGTPVAVGPELDDMLRLGLEISRLTGGAFDPTAGPLVEAWGFPEHPALPGDEARERAIALVDWREVARLDDTFPVAAGGGRVERAWRLARPGMAVDLGGLAKGWAVDAAADIAAEKWGNCLVNVGGDLVVRGAKPGGRPWTIGVQDPRDPGEIFLKLALADGMAVATSGDYQRNFEKDGVIYHHLLDPATGRPARGANSATVIATTCALADAWATAAFVLGAEEGVRMLEAMPNLEGILAVVDESGALVVHETSGVAALKVE